MTGSVKKARLPANRPTADTLQFFAGPGRHVQRIVEMPAQAGIFYESLALRYESLALRSGGSNAAAAGFSAALMTAEVCGSGNPHFSRCELDV